MPKRKMIFFLFHSLQNNKILPIITKVKKYIFFSRASTANYAPIKYRFGSTTYEQHFQERKPFRTAFVIPYSRHRSNNPQPNMVNSYNYPDGVSLNCSTGSLPGQCMIIEPNSKYLKVILS